MAEEKLFYPTNCVWTKKTVYEQLYNGYTGQPETEPPKEFSSDDLSDEDVQEWVDGESEVKGEDSEYYHECVADLNKELIEKTLKRING